MRILLLPEIMRQLFLKEAMASTTFQEFFSSKGIHFFKVSFVIEKFPRTSMCSRNILTVVMGIKPLFNTRRVANVPFLRSFAFKNVNEIHSMRV